MPCNVYRKFNDLTRTDSDGIGRIRTDSGGIGRNRNCSHGIGQIRPDSAESDGIDRSGSNLIGRNRTDSDGIGRNRTEPDGIGRPRIGKKKIQVRRGPEAGSPTPAKEMVPRLRATALRTQKAVSAVTVAPRHPARPTRHRCLETPSAVRVARRWQTPLGRRRRLRERC